MAHLPALVSDLALILITAGAVTILFKWLRQPVVLGYIVAGFLISPHFYLMPSVADMANISVWAEIGVIFLLFALGLEFSFKKLMDVGGKATIATLINMGSMIAIGYLIGQAMGWTQMECLFLGGMLSMSSTTIIIKAFNDMGLQKKRFAGIVFGMLIVEDLAAILMMVLLSTVAVSRHFEGGELMQSGFRLLFFILIWFVVGIALIPTLLKKLRKFLNGETLLIVAVGLCLGMVLFASAVGFSAALGAFIMGSILAETVESKTIEHLTEPLKNLFGAVFFVSVGMMIVPEVIVTHALPILILTAVVLVGRVIFATIGVMASGEGLKVSLQAGFSLAQIGEFSFIIATLGMQLGVLSDFIYPIIVAVSVVTTFTTPYFIRASAPAYRQLEKLVPRRWAILLDGYAGPAQKGMNRRNEWNRLLRSTLIAVAVYFVLSLAIVLLAKNYLYPFATAHMPGRWGAVLGAAVALITMSPFLSAIMKRGNNSPESKKLWADSHFNKAALIALNLVRIVLCVILIVIALNPLFPSVTGLLLIVATCLAIVLSFYQGFRPDTSPLERRFFHNLNEKQLAEERKRPLARRFYDDLSDRNLHVQEFEVPPHSASAGRTLAELDFRLTTGVHVVCIIRGRDRINIPDGSVRIFPLDRIVVVGTDDKIQQFMNRIAETDKRIGTPDTDDRNRIELSQYVVEPGSPLIGRTVAGLRIKRRTGCLVTGIERDGEMIADFRADYILGEGDTLWLAGERKSLTGFEENLLGERESTREGA